MGSIPKPNPSTSNPRDKNHKSTGLSSLGAHSVDAESKSKRRAAIHRKSSKPGLRNLEIDSERWHSPVAGGCWVLTSALVALMFLLVGCSPVGKGGNKHEQTTDKKKKKKKGKKHSRWRVLENGRNTKTDLCLRVFTSWTIGEKQENNQEEHS